MILTKKLINIINDEEINNKSPEELLKYFIKNNKNKIGFSNSFSIEDMVLTHMLLEYKNIIENFTLDTGRLPQETYELMQNSMKKYNIKFKIYFPNYLDIEKITNNSGPNYFYSSIENRKECCYYRKIKQLKRALNKKNIWITGLRKAQSITRKDVQKIEWDDNFKILKLNPLCDWSKQDVWDYIKKYNIPYNKLYDIGYESIGCKPCTRPITKIENIRAGRWWWEQPEHKECGLHIKKNIKK